LRAIPLLFSEARAHENLPTVDGVNEIFGGPEEREVIDAIVQRIRREDSPSPMPEPKPEPPSDPETDKAEAPE
jgi:hypothetical protein